MFQFLKHSGWFPWGENLLAEFFLVPLEASHCDTWTENLGLPYHDERRTIKTPIILDSPFAHHVASIATDEQYALVETDYFGGNGDQVAAVFNIGEPDPVYHSARLETGPINEALRMLGVVAVKSADEFDTLGLGFFRNTDDFFYDD